MDIKVAVFVDASFFLKRLNFFKKRYVPSETELTPKWWSSLPCITTSKEK